MTQGRSATEAELDAVGAVCSRTEATNRLGDRRESIGEVRAAPTPNLDAPALLAGENAESVVLHLVQPARSSWRAIDQRGFAGADEASRRISAPTGRRGSPRCGFQLSLNPLSDAARGSDHTPSDVASPSCQSVIYRGEPHAAPMRARRVFVVKCKPRGDEAY